MLMGSMVLASLLIVGCGGQSDDDLLIEELLAENFHDIDLDGWDRGRSLVGGEVIVDRGDETEAVASELRPERLGTYLRPRVDQTTERSGVHFLRAIWNADEPLEHVDDAREAAATVVEKAEADGYVVLEERCDDELYVLAAALDDEGAVVVVEVTTVVDADALIVSQSTLIADLRTDPGVEFDLTPATARCASRDPS